MPKALKYAIGLVVLIIIALIVIPQFLFTVDETDQALVLRFGEFNRQLVEPGLKTKVPFIETVTKFDKRLLRFDAPPETLITLDKKNLIIDAYARYKITDPRKFFETVLDVPGADARLRDIISGELKKEIASYDQSDIILNQRRTGTIDGVPTIVQTVTDVSRESARDIGVQIIDVRIKRADFTETINQSIFQRMNAERQQEAALFRAEGAEFDFRIRALADRTRTITVANAMRDSDIIRGCGEAIAVKIFASAFNKDPEFYNFQRSLEAYSNALSEQDTLVLEANSDFFRYLNNFEGRLNGELPPLFPGSEGESTLSQTGLAGAASEEVSLIESYTTDLVTDLIWECERGSGFIQDFAGTVESVEVVSTFEAGLTTTIIEWNVNGAVFKLIDFETEVIGDAELDDILPSSITADDVVGREVEVVTRREPDESRLAIRVTFR
jgi:membrane protease subunit HflC